ncbi:hypothetical protein NLX69_02340 [Rossellomorea sp. BNER]|nr:hypothetical protein [Rossellomorea sp. BNER]
MNLHNNQDLTGKEKMTVRKGFDGAVKIQKRENGGTKEAQWCREKP